MFWSPEVLAKTIGWLSGAGYEIVKLDASAWAAPTDMMVGVGTALAFPDYFGRNLNALEDCMREVASGDYGVRPDATGLVLILLGYDQFAGRCAHEAHALLDIFAGQALNAALIGRRLICLVHTNDPHLRFDAVGATPVGWNDAEVLDSKRG